MSASTWLRRRREAREARRAQRDAEAFLRDVGATLAQAKEINERKEVKFDAHARTRPPHQGG